MDNLKSEVIFTLHYSGEKISNHKMKLEDFLTSLQGFELLVNEIAKEIGIPKECLQLEIKPLEQGGLKTNIVAGLIGLSTFIAGNLGDHFLDDIHLYERLGLPHLTSRINQFLDKKKSVSDYKNFTELTRDFDLEATHIMMNKQVHQAAENFISVLNKNVDVLEFSSNINNDTERITKKDIPNFRNPFLEQDLEEKIYDEEKILRLDGPRSSKSKWVFYEKNVNGKWDKEKIFHATVLDDFLLSFGRGKSLEELKDKDLYCTVRYKEIVKIGNKKKTIEKYIIKCRVKPDSLF